MQLCRRAKLHPLLLLHVLLLLEHRPLLVLLLLCCCRLLLLLLLLLRHRCRRRRPLLLLDMRQRGPARGRPARMGYWRERRRRGASIRATRAGRQHRRVGRQVPWGWPAATMDGRRWWPVGTRPRRRRARPHRVRGQESWRGWVGRRCAAGGPAGTGGRGDILPKLEARRGGGAHWNRDRSMVGWRYSGMRQPAGLPALHIRAAAAARWGGRGVGRRGRRATRGEAEDAGGVAVGRTCPTAQSSKRPWWRREGEGSKPRGGARPHTHTRTTRPRARAGRASNGAPRRAGASDAWIGATRARRSGADLSW